MHVCQLFLCGSRKNESTRASLTDAKHGSYGIGPVDLALWAAGVQRIEKATAEKTQLHRGGLSAWFNHNPQAWVATTLEW